MRAALIQACALLREGETVAFSRFPSDVVDELLLEGGVSSIVRGSRKSLKVVSRAAFDVYLRSKGLQPDKLPETVAVLSGADSRASQVQLLGDSKAVAVRSCPGFPVNVIGPLSVRLGERKLLLCPCPGSFLYISDFLSFASPPTPWLLVWRTWKNSASPSARRPCGKRFGSSLAETAFRPFCWCPAIPSPGIW